MSGGTTGSGGATSSGGTTSSGGAPVGSGGGSGSGSAPPSSGGAESGSGGAPVSGNLDCDLPALDAVVGPATSKLEVLPWAGKVAAVSYTFDDATSSQISAYDAINAFGVPFTFYLTTGWINNDAPWKKAFEDGHEIGNHSQTHPAQATGAQLDDATAYIEEHIGVTPLTMAAPNGNSSYESFAMSRFLMNRGVGGGSISASESFNRYSLRTFIPPAGAGKESFDGAVNTAISQGNWQTVLVHGFADFNDGSYQAVSLNGFVGHLEGVVARGDVWIDTVLSIGSYLIGQQLVEEATPSQNGSETTFTWSLPEHFPEGRCLRIRSTGSVRQNGAVIPQDPMGYFDISLDAGQLTIVE